MLFGRRVGIKTGDFSIWEEFSEFLFEIFSAKAFVKNSGVMTFWAGDGDSFFMSARVTEKLEIISVKSERE